MSKVVVLAWGGLCIALAAGATAGDWPQFRGASGTGFSEESHQPSEWGTDAHIRWKAKVPGTGWSQPIVWGDRVYVTSAQTDTPPAAGPRRGGPGGRPPREGRPPRDREAADGAAADGATPDEGATPAASAPDADNAERPAPDSPGGGRPGGRGFGRPGGGGFGGFGGKAPDAVYRWQVHCLDRDTGRVIWSKVAEEGKPTIPTHSTNTYASETPVTDGQHLYAYFGMTGLYCYDNEGNLVWSKKLGSFPMMLGWGTGSSPVLAGDVLCIQCDNEEDSFLVGFDKLTGEEKWRVKREEKTSWSTPYLWRNRLRSELVTAGGKKVRSYNPANGELLWELDGFSGRSAATPVGDQDLVYCGTGGGLGGSGPLAAIKAGASGEIKLPLAGQSNDAVAWVMARSGPPMASPLLYQGHLYILEQRGGLLRCHNAQTGALVYRQRLPEGHGFTASPWASNGKVFCLDEDGNTFVIKAGPEYELLGTNKIADRFWASSALAGNFLLLRGVDQIYCIE